MKSWLIRKDPDVGKDRRQVEKGISEDEMGGWHHWLNGPEFEQTPAVDEGQGNMACCSPCGYKETDMIEQLNSNYRGINDHFFSDVQTNLTYYSGFRNMCCGCLVTKSYPILLWSLLISSIHGILQARILEWVVISFSRGSSWHRDRTQVSCTADRFFTIWAMRGLHISYMNINIIQAIWIVKYSYFKDSTKFQMSWWLSPVCIRDLINLATMTIYLSLIYVLPFICKADFSLENYLDLMICTEAC